MPNIEGEDWKSVDRWLMGQASVDSTIAESLNALCHDIGVRWGGSPSERAAAEYSARRFGEFGLHQTTIEEFPLATADITASCLEVPGASGWSLDARPCLFCPPIDVEAELIDVGFGMPHELEPLRDRVAGKIALLRAGFEPFTEPRPLPLRLAELADLGAAAVVIESPHDGRRLSHISASDWRDDPARVLLAVVQTSREDAARLRHQVTGRGTLRVFVETNFREATSWNSIAELPGADWPEETLLLGAHHDTTPDSVGANDNAAGVAVMLETARLLAELSRTVDAPPGRTIRFVSFGAEEQGLQGSAAYVDRHCRSGSHPRFMLALDELATGTMKGVVLQFPELRSLVQQQLDSMHEGLQCHVLAQLDASGDMFPFARVGIPSAFLWRWRFFGRHPQTAFGHSSSDTPEKVRIRELKEYAGLLSRLLLRLSRVGPRDWPVTEFRPDEFARRLESERGAVFRTM